VNPRLRPLALPLFLLPLAGESFASEPGARTPEPRPNPTSVSAPTIPDAVLRAVHQPLGLASATLLFDETEDGSIWVVGADWKASFGPAGAVYYPRVGAHVARSAPHALSPARVTVGGVAVPFERVVRATRTGDHIALDRGSFVETYDLGLETIEQSFVFAAAPGTGDLEIEIPFASELQAAETAEGIEFRSEGGHVTYSRAVAVDAASRRTSAATRVASGSIQIRIDAGVMAEARYPLVIDPILNSIFPDISAADTFDTDTAYDAFGGVWVVVWEVVFSATDHDVHVKSYTANGTLMSSSVIDASVDSWVAPRVADLAFPAKFLAVAGVTASVGGAKTVRGRIFEQNGTILTSGAQFAISTGMTGAFVQPDVGGDPFPASSSKWCVVFERVLPGVDHSNPDTRIAYAIVDSSGATSGSIQLTPGPDDVLPSISNSNGTVAWMVAWQRDDPLTLGNIVAAQLTWTGALLSGPFTIASGLSDETLPSASSPLTGTQITAVTWQRGASSRDIMVALIDGSTILQTVNLMTLEGSPTSAQDQIQPSIDSDGEHFLVSYSETESVSGRYLLFVTDLAVVGNTLAVVQNHLQVLPSPTLSELRSNVAAARAPGLLDHRYLVVFDVAGSAPTHNVVGVFVDGLSGGNSSPFCFGDGSGTACPCGNNGAIGHGCGNSVTPAGGLLTVTGTPSTLDDSIVLHVSGLPATSNCTFFQGTVANAAAVFGDGLRCTGGTLIRLRSTGASAGSANFPTGGDPHVSTQGAVTLNGGLRTYQVMYRNAPSFCTTATFNISNGLIVNWAR